MFFPGSATTQHRTTRQECADHLAAVIGRRYPYPVTDGRSLLGGDAWFAQRGQNVRLNQVFAIVDFITTAMLGNNTRDVGVVAEFGRYTGTISVAPANRAQSRNSGFKRHRAL